jgi:RimJ/RimL family protein N-acetyltransferase
MISGRRVTLRPVEERDYPLIHTWQNDPDVWWRMDYERPFSLQDIADDAESSRKEGVPFVIEAEGRPVGRIGLNQFRTRDRICSLYLFVGDRRAWGKGYAKDAVATLLRYAFERWDLYQVELWALAVNEPAIRVYEACGFVPDARLRARSFKDGAWVDRIVMSVRRGEFERSREGLERRLAAGDEGEAGDESRDRAGPRQVQA